jgi:hypothetical protein
MRLLRELSKYLLVRNAPGVLGDGRHLPSRAKKMARKCGLAGLQKSKGLQEQQFQLHFSTLNRRNLTISSIKPGGIRDISAVWRTHFDLPNRIYNQAKRRKMGQGL